MNNIDLAPRPALAYRHRAHHGVTFIELMVAAMIMALSLTALIGSWIGMINSVLTTDKRAQAANIGRGVMEKFLNNGYFEQLSQLPETESLPSGELSTSTNWNSENASLAIPSFADQAWFNNDGFEVSCNNVAFATTCAHTPGGFVPSAKYYVTTQLDFTTNRAQADQNLLTVHVVVSSVNSDGSVNTPPLFTDDQILTEGGVL